jgi:replicative DNA helicase
VLGAILVHNDAFNLAAEVIDSRDFYRDAHRRIFDRMVTLNERRDAIDFVTLKEELSRAGELDEVGGPAYVASLADGVPRATVSTARIVSDTAESDLRRTDLAKRVGRSRIGLILDEPKAPSSPWRTTGSGPALSPCAIW